MIDKTMVKTKIRLIQKDLKELKRFEKMSFDDMAKNYLHHKAVERIIEVIINEAIDINQHLISEKKSDKISFDFKESFLILAELKVYPQKFAGEISLSIGLRNILVHQYRKLDEEIFYQSIGQCLRQYSQYCRYILKYLEKKS